MRDWPLVWHPWRLWIFCARRRSMARCGQAATLKEADTNNPNSSAGKLVLISEGAESPSTLE
jgi:hypothetical protein